MNTRPAEPAKPIIDAMWHWGKDFLETLPEERLKPLPQTCEHSLEETAGTSLPSAW